MARRGRRGRADAAASTLILLALLSLALSAARAARFEHSPAAGRLGAGRAGRGDDDAAAQPAGWRFGSKKGGDGGSGSAGSSVSSSGSSGSKKSRLGSLFSVSFKDDDEPSGGGKAPAPAAAPRSIATASSGGRAAAPIAQLQQQQQAEEPKRGGGGLFGGLFKREDEQLEAAKATLAAAAPVTPPPRAAVRSAFETPAPTAAPQTEMIVRRIMVPGAPGEPPKERVVVVRRPVAPGGAASAASGAAAPAPRLPRAAQAASAAPSSSSSPSDAERVMQLQKLKLKQQQASKAKAKAEAEAAEAAAAAAKKAEAEAEAAKNADPNVKKLGITLSLDDLARRAKAAQAAKAAATAASLSAAANPTGAVQPLLAYTPPSPALVEAAKAAAEKREGEREYPNIDELLATLDALDRAKSGTASATDPLLIASTGAKLMALMPKEGGGWSPQEFRDILKRASTDSLGGRDADKIARLQSKMAEYAEPLLKSASNITGVDVTGLTGALKNAADLAPTVDKLLSGSVANGGRDYFASLVVAADAVGGKFVMPALGKLQETVAGKNDTVSKIVSVVIGDGKEKTEEERKQEAEAARKARAGARLAGGDEDGKKRKGGGGGRGARRAGTLAATLAASDDDGGDPDAAADTTTTPLQKFAKLVIMHQGGAGAAALETSTLGKLAGFGPTAQDKQVKSALEAATQAAEESRAESQMTAGESKRFEKALGAMVTRAAEEKKAGEGEGGDGGLLPGARQAAPGGGSEQYDDAEEETPTKKKLDSSDFLARAADPKALNNLLDELDAKQKAQRVEADGGGAIVVSRADLDAAAAGGKRKGHGGGLAALSDPDMAGRLASLGLGADALSAYGAEAGSMAHLKAIAAKAAAAPPPPPPSRVAQVLASMVGNYTAAVATPISTPSKKRGGRASVRLNNGKGAVVPPLGSVLYKDFPAFASVAALPANSSSAAAAPLVFGPGGIVVSGGGSAASSAPTNPDEWLGGFTDVYYQRDMDRLYALAGDGPSRGRRSWFARVHRWDGVGEDAGAALATRPPSATLFLTLPPGVALLGPSASGAVAELMDADERAASATATAKAAAPVAAKKNNATTTTTAAAKAPAAAAQASKATPAPAKATAAAAVAPAPAAAKAAAAAAVAPAPAAAKAAAAALPKAAKAAVRRRVMLEVSASVTAAAVNKAQQAQQAAEQARAQQQQGVAAAAAAVTSAVAAKAAPAPASTDGGLPDRAAAKASAAMAAAEAAAKAAAERRAVAKAKKAAEAAKAAAASGSPAAAAAAAAAAASAAKPAGKNDQADAPIPVYTAARVASVFGMPPDANATRRFDTIDPSKAAWGQGGRRVGLSLAPAGLAVSRTGVLYVGDAYGPAIYAFGPDGSFMRALDVPEELLPRRRGANDTAAGAFDFSSRVSGDDDASGDGDEEALRAALIASGRQPRRGFGALAFTPGDSTLLAVMAGPLASDGGRRGGAVRIVRFSPYTGAATAQHAFNLDSVAELNQKASDYNFVLKTPRPRDLSELPTGAQGRALQVTGLVAANETHWMVLETDNRGYGPDDPALNYLPVAKRISIVDATDASDVNGVASLPSRLPTPVVKRDRKTDEWYLSLPETSKYVGMRKVLYMDVLSELRALNAERANALGDRLAKEKELSLPPLSDSEMAAFDPVPIAAEWSGMTAGPPQDGQEGTIAEMRLIVVTNNRFGRFGGGGGGGDLPAVMCAAPYEEPAVNWELAREVSGYVGDAENVARALEPGKRSAEDEAVLRGMKEANVTSWGEAFKMAAGNVFGKGAGAAGGGNGTAAEAPQQQTVTQRAAMAAQNLLATEDVVRAYEVERARTEAAARAAADKEKKAAKAAAAKAAAAAPGNATAAAAKGASNATVAAAAPVVAAAKSNATAAAAPAAAAAGVSTNATAKPPQLQQKQADAAAPSTPAPPLFQLVPAGKPCPAGTKPVPTYLYTLSTQGGRAPASSVTDAVFQRQSKNLKRGSAASGLLSASGGASAWGDDAAGADQQARAEQASSGRRRKGGPLDDFDMGDDDQ